MNNFVPLHIVSCYSFLQSGLTMEKIQTSIVKNDYFGMGLCDNNVMFGVPSFVKASEQIKRPYIIGLGVKVNDDYLQKVLYKPWAADGSNFSDRIWTNKDKLLNEIHTELTQSILTGADPQKAIDAISHNLDVSKANAGRLVMTESAYFGTLAQQDCFNNLGVEEYEIVATLDDRTSAICQSMDGQHFPMKDFEAGVSAPPFHVNCRSCTCPYFDDEFSLGERAARDENGEVYYVPADTTYPEWKEKYVKDGEENVEKSANKGYNHSRDYEQYERYKNVIETSYMPDTFEEFKRIKYEDKAAYGKLKHSYRILNAYEDNSGHMDRKKLIELDQFAYDTKTKDFTGKAKRQANIAVMEIDGEIKIGNSQVNAKTDTSYVNFKGEKELLVIKTESPVFKTIEVGSHGREMDSEAKLLEYAAKIVDDGNVHTIDLLSEKCMCESCRGVLEQFKEKYPSVNINVVSNKVERASRNHNKPWGYRNN